MHQTFQAAFATVRSVLTEKLTVSYGLLTELQRRNVLLPPQIQTIMVRWRWCIACLSLSVKLLISLIWLLCLKTMSDNFVGRCGLWAIQYMSKRGHENNINLSISFFNVESLSVWSSFRSICNGNTWQNCTCLGLQRALGSNVDHVSSKTIMYLQINERRWGLWC